MSAMQGMGGERWWQGDGFQTVVRWSGRVRAKAGLVVWGFAFGVALDRLWQAIQQWGKI